LAWDDAKKAKAVELYKAGEPTPENSMEIVAEIAEELGETANGVRMILSKADVYIKKDPSKASAKKSTTSSGNARVSKEDAHNGLIAAIEAANQKADEEIISKMTGKAAIYFTGLFNAIAGESS
jgi:hypothetical protein